MDWHIKAFFSLQKDDLGRTKDCWGCPSDTPALSTCSNADIFRRINAMLDNSLDFTGVCTTPNAKGKCDHLQGTLLCGYYFCASVSVDVI